MSGNKPIRPVARLACIAALLGVAGCARGPGADNASEAARRDERSAEWFWREGRLAAQRGDTVRAEQYLTLALERGYEPREVLPMLLAVCLSSSRLRAALNHAEPYLRNHPDDHALRYLVANIELGLGQAESARSELERIAHEDPKHADAHYLLGALEMDRNVAEAKRYFLRYLALAPNGDRAAEVRGRLAELAFRGESAGEVGRGRPTKEAGR